MKENQNKNDGSLKVTSVMSNTLAVVFLLILVFCALLMGRLIYLNNVNGDKYAKAVLSQQSYSTREIKSQRGRILDRNGVVLAKNDTTYTLYLDSTQIFEQDYYTVATFRAFRDFFGFDTKKVYDILAEKYGHDGGRYILYQPGIQYTTVSDFKKYVADRDKNEDEKKNTDKSFGGFMKKLVEKLKNSSKTSKDKSQNNDKQDEDKIMSYEDIMNSLDRPEEKSNRKFVTGIHFEEDMSRIYPYSDLASHVIGFSTAGVGTEGLEAVYDEELTGTDGVTSGYFDSDLNSRRVVKEPIDGNDVVSTIDYNVQAVIEDKVSTFIETIGCENIGVIVMNPNNGEILGMTSNREYDLNNPRSLEAFYSEEEIENMTYEQKGEALSKIWRNFCISDGYEPGSTFKTITVASALEEDVVLKSDTFNCNGYREYGGWTINCSAKYGHGTITLEQALTKSCNCALMDIAEKMGKADFFKYQAKFGFGAKTGIDLKNESNGKVFALKELNPTELASSSFGTTFNVTMIQMAAAYASILNGGTYYKPHLVNEIRTSKGATVRTIEPEALRRTVSTNTAEYIRNALYKTVEDGTGTPAKVSGYMIGGKTGTAQKHPRTIKKYVVSFIGFTPVSHPEVLVYVVMDEIHDEDKHNKSSSASGMTAEIMKEILPYLGLYPDGEIEYNVDLSLLEKADEENGDESNPDVLPEGIDD